MSVLFAPLVAADPASAVIMVGVVVGIQIGIGNHAPGVGGVDKLAVAHINTNMGQATGVGVLEDHHVAGLQICLGNIGALGVHVHDHAGHLIAQRIVDVVHKTGAVETGGGGAAPLIGGTQELLGEVNNLLAGQSGGSGIGILSLAAIERFRAGLRAGGLAAAVLSL